MKYSWTHHPIPKGCLPTHPLPRGNHSLKLIFIMFFFPFKTVLSLMHVASLVLLAKETKWIYAANWGCSSKVAFLGPDPLMRGGCTYSNPSGSPLFEISCRDIFISSSRIIAVTLWHVSSDWAFPITSLSSSLIYLSEKCFLRSMNRDSVLETSGEPGRAWLPWSRPHPSPALLCHSGNN